MTYRQAKLPFARRILAVGCIAIWVAGVSACDIEALFCCDSHGREATAHADQEQSHETEHAGTNDPHDADAPHSGEADSHSHDSPMPGSREGSCCCSLKAVAVNSTPVAFGKPAFLLIPVLCVPLEAPATALARLPSPPSRDVPRSRDRVLKPEVCLGPAFQSNAPPVVG